MGDREKISIITVSYNCRESIQDSIRSILAQTFAPYEYRIVDGGSRDGTAEVAESFRAEMEKRGILYRVVSEPDKGIYNAMNKGIRLAEGDVIGILNCGDTFEPDALRTVDETFRDTGCEMMFASLRVVRRDGKSFVKKGRLRKFQTSRDWNHPTTFVRAKIYQENPFLEKGIHDDYGFFLKMRKQGRKIAVSDKVLATFHMGGESNKRDLRAAGRRIRDRYLYCYRVNGYSRWYLAECVFIEAVKWVIG